jgi:hypothetical protein
MRLEVPHEYLDQYIRLITKYVLLVPTELLFNIDESGFSDWEERNPKCVLTPAEAREITLHYPASQKIRHQTLVCCVTDAGDAYSPLLVSSDPAARAVFEYQIRDGIDFRIEINPSPYVNAEIFERYVDTVLIPAVEANRQLPGCDKNQPFCFATIVQLTCRIHCSRNWHGMGFLFSHIPSAFLSRSQNGKSPRVPNLANRGMRCLFHSIETDVIP